MTDTELVRAAIPKEDAVTFDEPRQSLVYLLASRVCQQQAIRDGSGNVGFRCADGRVATIPRADFEPQLRDALTRALTESRYWGE